MLATKELQLYRALDCKTRYDIYEQLYSGPKDVKEIAQKLSIGIFTARYHLEELESSGLVRRSEIHVGKNRPRTSYQLDDRSKMLTVPKREYFGLARLLLRALITELGEEKSKKVLRKAGRQRAMLLLDNLAKEHQLQGWTVQGMKRHYIDDWLSEMAGSPESVEEKDDRLVFRIYNCPIRELAEQNFEYFCDALEKGFKEGVVEATSKKLHFDRKKCLAKGDDFCEFEINVDR